MNFFWQHHKLKDVTESQFVETCESDEDREVTLNCKTPKEQQQRYIHTYIYINKSLTEENEKLLKEGRDKSRAKKHKCKGCTIGQVYAWKTDTSDVI